MSLDQESSAIKRLYGILPLVLFVSAVGGVLVIDELESHLHPQIVNKLLELFLKFNSNNAQLIFTTHQVLLMD
ncbi:AAA family ATPase, partial [Vibrio parahaemolyticus]|uniref:AAA family ATPase n=1 Tax=Vibrio parahaemolyticus TaxID=670 RepID=UPI001E50DBE7